MELAQHQLRMWAELGTVIEDGVKSNARAVAAVQQTFADDLLRSMGVKPSAAFRNSMLRTAESGVKTYLARESMGVSLSERVYRNGQVASGRIDRVVNNGLLRGASAREIARDVAGLINPNTPGGVSYAAMRLGRTELANSFHKVNNDSYDANPFVQMVGWNLSESHPDNDICDDLAEDGPYDPKGVPDKPHPHCLCYTTPEVMSDDELVARFRNGEFDEWADAQLAS
jgi:hypothetical protein